MDCSHIELVISFLVINRLAFCVFQVYGRILFMFYQQKKKFEQIKEVQNQRKISNNGSSWATHAASTAAAALRYVN